MPYQLLTIKPQSRLVCVKRQCKNRMKVIKSVEQIITNIMFLGPTNGLSLSLTNAVG